MTGTPGRAARRLRAGRRAPEADTATPRAAPTDAGAHAALPPVRGDAGLNAGCGTAFSTAREGDVLLVLGSPWHSADYAQAVAAAKKDNGLRFAVLIYDMIPFRRPEWCDGGLTEVFIRWMRTVLPLADLILTISKSTADDVRSYLRGLGLEAPEPLPIPVGTGFSLEPAGPAADKPRQMPEPGTYALIVSTIEVRKNHALLLRVWRRLLSEMPRDAVPPLVFAGRVGWLVGDFMQQLRNSRFLDGKIILFEDPTDRELAMLYAGCQFTLFPSFYEGWGLPVTESLAYGRPCIISNTTSMPEAGGRLASYFDPEDGQQAYQVIRDAIEHPARVAEWRERIIREFRPVPWQTPAEAVIGALDRFCRQDSREASARQARAAATPR